MNDPNSSHYWIVNAPDRVVDIGQVIENEIQWCKDHPMSEKVTSEFRDGFIKGLEQALFLIKTAKAKIA